MGHPNKCKNPGPILSGLTTESCQVYGGVFCPAPDNCTALQACVEDYEYWGGNNTRPAYAAYLSEAPAITDPTDRSQCIATREYFGFDGSFINDGQICDDIHQLRFTRDFLFMESFFNVGSEPGGATKSNSSTVVVPRLELTEPDICMYSV